MAPEVTRRMDVSVVIPTRNRLGSLLRLLSSLDAQTYLPREVIIVDASDEQLENATFESRFPRLSFRILHSRPHVCVQRNLGIKTAASEFIFLCDDDIEVTGDYIERVMEVFRMRSDVGAVSGLLIEPLSDGTFSNGFYPIGVLTLFVKFVFQQSVWTDVRTMKAQFPVSLLLHLVQRFYEARGNTFSLAGWPLLTNATTPTVRTAIYGLGGSIIRREWLLNSPFDESLDQHGIGENYGVALGFPGPTPLLLLKETPIVHHKVAEGRLQQGEVFVRRVLALDYFIATSGKFSPVNRFFLRWSLVGNYVATLIGRDEEMSRASWKCLAILMMNRNPYLNRKSQDREIPHHDRSKVRVY